MFNASRVIASLPSTLGSHHRERIHKRECWRLMQEASHVDALDCYASASFKNKNNL